MSYAIYKVGILAGWNNRLITLNNQYTIWSKAAQIEHAAKATDADVKQKSITKLSSEALRQLIKETKADLFQAQQTLANYVEPNEVEEKAQPIELNIKQKTLTPEREAERQQQDKTTK